MDFFPFRVDKTVKLSEAEFNEYCGEDKVSFRGRNIIGCDVGSELKIKRFRVDKELVEVDGEKEELLKLSVGAELERIMVWEHDKTQDVRDTFIGEIKDWMDIATALHG